MLSELFYNTRTCRSFDESRAVAREELLDMVNCARLTPSSANIQPLSYRLVFEREEGEALLSLTKWAAALPGLELPPRGHHPRSFIVICQDTARFGDESRFKYDVGIAALAIYLRAAEMGLSGCMIGSFDKPRTAELLSLPENVVPLLVIALGKADEERRLASVIDDETRYFRSDGVHFVPKRELHDIIIEN